MINKKAYLRMGLIVSVTTFILLAVAVRFLLRTPLQSENYVAFFIFSLITGGITSILIYTQARIAAGLFILGLGLGFLEMYRVFMNGMSGWGDLIGLLSLFFWAAIGLGSGILIQIGINLLQRKKKKG